jgi:hypothetical protein
MLKYNVQYCANKIGEHEKKSLECKALSLHPMYEKLKDYISVFYDNIDKYRQQ